MRIPVIYLWTTPQLAQNLACTSGSQEINRVARFTIVSDTVQSGSETIVLNNINSPCGNHNGGSLNFGADGLLYISTGDGGCDNTTSRNLSLLNGKMLRIQKDGGVPASNPYVATSGSVVCNANSANASGGTCQEIFASGLRNPFKTAFKHGTNEFYINDVGQNIWEEINVGQIGADYGWSVREGPCQLGVSSGCSSNPVSMTAPIYAYRHASLMCSITGGAFSTVEWSATYSNTYFFTDWCADGAIFQLTPKPGGGYQHTTFHNAPSTNDIASLYFDPGTRALYYGQDGGVRRIRYSDAATNRAPTAVIAASPRSGSLPLTVVFDASASTDPDGDALTFGWLFGDGSTSNAANPSHIYGTAGVVTATLTVTDALGLASTPVTVNLYPGNTPPTALITGPVAGTKMLAGKAFTLTATGFDAEDGTLNASAFSWDVRLHHVSTKNPGSQHSHPLREWHRYDTDKRDDALARRSGCCCR